jgi:hypothetical protein
VDFRFLPNDDRSEATWVKRSAETALENRLVWVCGDTEQLAQQARELIKSKGIVKKYQPRRESLSDARRILLQSEELRTEELQEKLQDEVAAAWMSGNMYFRERKIEPTEHGSGFATTLKTVAERLLSDLFFQFDPITVLPAELAQLLEADLSGPSPKFLKDELGILELDAGRYVPTCSGVIPRRILERIEKEDGTSGGALISNFAGPPFGYTPEVVKACVLGLLRASKLQIETEDGTKITAPRDAGVRDVFDKVTSFRRATLLPSGDDDIGVTARAKICKFFEDSLHDPFDRRQRAKAFPQRRQETPRRVAKARSSARFVRDTVRAHQAERRFGTMPAQGSRDQTDGPTSQEAPGCFARRRPVAEHLCRRTD